MSTENLTTAEKWFDVLDNVAGNELEAALAAMHGEHLQRYTTHDGWEYFLFADGSVYCSGDDCYAKEDLLEGSNAGLSFMFDGLVRTFWPHAQPEIGDMTQLFDTETFSEFAGDRTYHFTFGTWLRTEDEAHVEFTVDVLALFTSAGNNGQPTAFEFTLCVEDCWGSVNGEGERCNVDYTCMPVPDVGASWNHPLRWQEVVNDMESFCASIVHSK